MKAAAINSLVHRTGVFDLNLHDTLCEAVNAYREDPLFCIPTDARATYARCGARTEVILLGATPFSRTFLSEAFDRVRVTAVVDDFRAASGDVFEGLPIITSIVPGRLRVHPLGAIAARTVFSLGGPSTSATFR